ncbi:hypothetical protein KC356_g176 [Hortaea werneckii]|nr:hypothetical protein KC356_g176 [Hortaea werneckii]
MDPSKPSTSPTTSSRSPVTSLVTLLSVFIRDGLMSKDSKTRFTMSTRWPSMATDLGARPVLVRHQRCRDAVSTFHFVHAAAATKALILQAISFMNKSFTLQCPFLPIV